MQMYCIKMSYSSEYLTYIPKNKNARVIIFQNKKHANNCQNWLFSNRIHYYPSLDFNYYDNKPVFQIQDYPEVCEISFNEIQYVSVSTLNLYSCSQFENDNGDLLIKGENLDTFESPSSFRHHLDYLYYKKF